MEQKKSPADWAAAQSLKSKKNRAICNDMLLRLFSLCLGTLIWFLVVGADRMDMTVSVPIEVLNLPKDLVIYNQYQKELNVTLRGPRSIMQEMRSRNLSLPIDLAKAEPDTIVVNTETLSLPLPSGVSILSMQPASITLSIDKLIQKQMPITPEIEGKVADGYALKELVLNPDKILVSGPKKLLDQQQSLSTSVISLDELDRSASLPVRLNLSPDFENLIGETAVVAKVTIGEEFVEKTVRKIPVQIMGADKAVAVKPEAVSVIADIPKCLIKENQPLSTLFKASVRIGLHEELPRKVPVTAVGIPVPDHEPIVVKSCSPTEVELFLTEKPAYPEQPAGVRSIGSH